MLKISTSQLHPWHGVSPGADTPQKLLAYIEIVPTDSVKYEIDKDSGLLRVDRPQQFSSRCPSLYGFIPQSYCGDAIGAFCGEKTGRKGITGDGDPLDICVFTELPFAHGAALVTAIPIGGMRLIDGDQADDKIIAVLAGDLVYGKWTNVDQVPPAVIERLRHYFLTYKEVPGEGKRRVEITHTYGVEEARQVVALSLEDYRKKFKAN